MPKGNQKDQVAVILKRADAALDDWLRQAERERKRMESTLRRTTRQAVQRGAGALRVQVDDLQVRLEGLSQRLARLEPRRRPSSRRRPTPRRRVSPARPRPRKAA